MVQFITLEIDLGAAKSFREAAGKIKWAWPSGIVSRIVVKIALKLGRLSRLTIRGLKVQN